MDDKSWFVRKDFEADPPNKEEKELSSQMWIQPPKLNVTKIKPKKKAVQLM